MILRYDVSKLEQLLHSFFMLTHMRIVVFDADFQKIAEVPGQDSEFCQLIRKDAHANRRCVESDRHACLQCRQTGNLYSYTCHAGLTESAVPIRYENIIIGYLMFGQVLQSADKKSLWQGIEQHFTDNTAIDIEKLYRAFAQLQPLTKDMMGAATQILEACACYLWLERTISLQNDTLPVRISEYLSTHLDGDLSSQALCAQFSIGRTKLHQIAKEFFGAGIAQVVQNLRICEAKHLLETTDKTLEDIAEAMGYADYNYFIKVFRKKAGITPAKYRKTVNRQNDI